MDNQEQSLNAPPVYQLIDQSPGRNLDPVFNR